MSGQKILDGLAEALEYMRGNDTGARVHVAKVPDTIDVIAVRKKLHLSQAAFAARFGFSLSTVQNWEQGHRRPEGPARVLLKIIETDPDVVERALAAE